MLFMSFHVLYEFQQHTSGKSVLKKTKQIKLVEVELIHRSYVAQARSHAK